VELLVVLPVLLLLLLAAADMGKLFVISGKSEIAARYSALRHFRGAPFGDIHPVHTRAVEIERIFFDGALADDPDVTYQELRDDDLDYAPLDIGDPFLIWLWDFFNITENLVPIRGVRSTFTYDLPFFPYGREHPMQETLPLQDAPAEGRLAARYDASGHFVVLTDSFSGDEGEELRLLMEAAHLIVGMRLTAPAIPALLAVLWLIFLP